MAEILGVVASGITVVAVAGKVGDRFVKLKRLLKGTIETATIRALASTTHQKPRHAAFIFADAKT
ncbi:hypothetical protein B0O99DRAFT_640388 [Bisporella sp. PMI_857]|nr:hypothetical protein B0O99DRAFT_640388 [Bisporella sp. PMI_857]